MSNCKKEAEAYREIIGTWNKLGQSTWGDLWGMGGNICFSSPTLSLMPIFLSFSVFSVSSCIFLLFSVPAVYHLPSWFPPSPYFSIFLHDYVSVNLNLVVSLLHPLLPSLISTRAAREISRNPLPPFPTRHWWSVLESIQSTDHTGTHRDRLIMQPSTCKPLSCSRTRPHCFHLRSLCL